MSPPEHPQDEQISALIDGELSLVEREAVLHHLVGCPGCAHRQAELVEVAATFRARPPLAWTPELTARVADALAEPAPARAAGRRPIAVAVATAALVVLVAALAAVALAALPLPSLALRTILGAIAGLAPIGAASAGEAVAALIVVVVAAPALVYPLARWR